LKITDKNGNVLEEYEQNATQVLPEQSALLINDILRDNVARTPLYGANSPMNVPGREVAAKTGTTNDYRDFWIMGYTPQIVVGAWAGNNDNTPMVHKPSGLVITPMWREILDEALKDMPSVPFKRPDPIDPTLRPILRGVWQGGQVYTVDKTTGLLATDQTPPDLREDRAIPDVHTILYWVDRDNPKGPPPTNPQNDPQFTNWETSVRNWAMVNTQNVGGLPPTQTDNVHMPDAKPMVVITSPVNNSEATRQEKLNITIVYQGKFPLKKAEYYINNNLVGTTGNDTKFSFVPQNVQGIQPTNTIKVVVTDQYDNVGEGEITLHVH
jgi:membrane peptidoglycan carboxypeptidase